MLKKLGRYMVVVRGAGVLIIAALLVYVGYQVYDFYEDKIGFTPSKAIESYFDALAVGDYSRVYALTAKDRLTDIYGRPVTQGEFTRQVRGMVGEERLPFESVQISKLLERAGSRYYLVILHSSVSGQSGTSRLLLEIRREDKSWVITYPFAIVL